mgnify:CR=1 FL=1
MGRKKKRLRLALRKELAKNITPKPEEAPAATPAKKANPVVVEKKAAPKETVGVKTVEVIKDAKKKAPSKPIAKKTTKKS